MGTAKFIEAIFLFFLYVSVLTALHSCGFL